jgi:antitoxin CcdA
MLLLVSALCLLAFLRYPAASSIAWACASDFANRSCDARMLLSRINSNLTSSSHLPRQILAKPQLGVLAVEFMPFHAAICYPRASDMSTMMHVFFNVEMRMGKAPEVRPRKSTNITLPPEVLDRAKEMGIYLSRASERGVCEESQESDARRWANDNADLVAAYTAMVERDGLPLAKYRLSAVAYFRVFIRLLTVAC